MSAVFAWAFQRDRLADAVDRLRRRHPDRDDYDRILADRIAASLDSIDALLEPTAGELVSDGWQVDAALDRTDRHRKALYARMGGRP